MAFTLAMGFGLSASPIAQTIRIDGFDTAFPLTESVGTEYR